MTDKQPTHVNPKNITSSHLGPEQVLAIYKSRLSARQLAKIYSISHQSVQNIKRNKTWVHITNPKDPQQ